jgi:membrane protein implicated in regulation of membrane protease activity
MHTDPLKQLWNQPGSDADASEATAALNAWRRHRQYAAQRQLSAFSAVQVLQLLFWLALSIYCGSIWWQQPPLAVMLSAVALHAYSVAVIIVSAARLHLRGQLQPDQPVLQQSRQLALLRRQTAIGELLLGLPWCWLWLAVPVLIAWQAWGLDLAVFAARWLLVALLAGTAMMIALLVLARRWLQRDPQSPRLQRAIDALSGRRLARARAELAAVRAWNAG